MGRIQNAKNFWKIWNMRMKVCFSFSENSCSSEVFKKYSSGKVAIP